MKQAEVIFFSALAVCFFLGTGIIGAMECNTIHIGTAVTLLIALLVIALILLERLDLMDWEWQLWKSVKHAVLIKTVIAKFVS